MSFSNRPLRQIYYGAWYEGWIIGLFVVMKDVLCSNGIELIDMVEATPPPLPLDRHRKHNTLLLACKCPFKHSFHARYTKRGYDFLNNSPKPHFLYHQTSHNHVIVPNPRVVNFWILTASTWGWEQGKLLLKPVRVKKGMWKCSWV